MPVSDQLLISRLLLQMQTNTMDLTDLTVDNIMSNIPPIRDYMMSNPYTVQYENTASAAEKTMHAHKIRHLPVVDGKRIIGLVSEKDILLARHTYRQRKFDGEVLLKEISFSTSCMVGEDELLDKVTQKMANQKLEAVVVTSHGTPVGIFTVTDACRLLADLFKSHGQPKGLWAMLFG